jgi:hypothetical protein
VIELVVEALTGDPAEDWLFETNGAGITVEEPKVCILRASPQLLRASPLESALGTAGVECRS